MSKVAEHRACTASIIRIDTVLVGRYIVLYLSAWHLGPEVNLQQDLCMSAVFGVCCAAVAKPITLASQERRF